MSLGKKICYYRVENSNSQEELADILLHLKLARDLILERENEDLFIALSYRFGDRSRAQKVVPGFQEIDSYLNDLDKEIRSQRKLV
jgi:hypothetical protein